MKAPHVQKIKRWQHENINIKYQMQQKIPKKIEQKDGK